MIYTSCAIADPRNDLYFWGLSIRRRTCLPPVRHQRPWSQNIEKKMHHFLYSRGWGYWFVTHKKWVYKKLTRCGRRAGDQDHQVTWLADAKFEWGQTLLTDSEWVLSSIRNFLQDSYHRCRDIQHASWMDRTSNDWHIELHQDPHKFVICWDWSTNQRRRCRVGRCPS